MTPIRRLGRKRLAQEMRGVRDAQVPGRKPKYGGPYVPDPADGVGRRNRRGVGKAAVEGAFVPKTTGGIGGLPPMEKNDTASGRASAQQQAIAGRIGTTTAAKAQVTGAARSTAASGTQTGLGQNYQAGFGQQLSSRVSSGTIDQGRAKQTASERALLEQAYGANWRHHVYGDRGYMKRTREALAQNPDDPQVKALYAQLMRSRAEALAKAKEKLGQG